MEKRYVIFRVFSKNKFANKKEIIKGQILGSYSTIEEIALSEFYYSEERVQVFLRDIFSGNRIPNKGIKTYEQAKKEMIESSIGLIKDRMDRTGVMHNTDTNDMSIDEVKKLLTLNLGGCSTPVSFILLDLKHQNDTFIKQEKQWFREINLINLTQ